MKGWRNRQRGKEEIKDEKKNLWAFPFHIQQLKPIKK
ncbi:Hypothetical protein Minf_2373 [Methylacidiphilum infernorum V4]|uniref:Uncharacterized protein n=1 Tax=Methylacidiphilum infernorum (isolate V4) TaxID=481448 RepID=B3E0V0_METI4|nr:Hypothetical protein Minf_2373 [Methylacidiphilum infernorum V4]